MAYNRKYRPERVLARVTFRAAMPGLKGFLIAVLRSYPYGAAALSMLILATVAGLILAFNPPPKKQADLVFWTFAKPHYEAYLQVIGDFEKEHQVKVDMQLVSNQGLPQRLQAAFQADLDVPDMCEIEISSAGSFFRGPLEHVGFADLTDRIRSEGLDRKMVASRFAPYMSRGRVFGLPHDVHPVLLGYRRDIFEKEGIDVNTIETWDDFIEAGKKLTIADKRYMIEMSDTGSDQLETCLFQREGGYFDPQGKVTFDNEIAVETMKWYVPLVARNSKTRIANVLSSSFGTVIAQGMENTYFLSVVMPDWRSKIFENDIGKLSGKMALMPLPAVKKGGRRTSTWGGTMLGITRKCKDKDLAWKLAKFLYLNEKDLAGRFAGTNILPPVRAAWKEPAFDREYAYWSNQKLGRIYANFAPEVPAQYTHPFITLAKTKFGESLTACVQRYTANGENGFDEFVRRTLKSKADEVRRQIARNPF
ncbi:MAG: extracellular solute-binding protein [Capsulimonadales bacterium]|nr:extracellular solute-binding protein [Capsulimonadales bacterium]